ncbi:hypothetical protein Syn6312_2382 [Synechococcus sp. PCC 6312]|nr:hypothetical protein Syn6312_2382 [Synechococcus sp. PCC 6312]
MLKGYHSIINRDLFKTTAETSTSMRFKLDSFTQSQASDDGLHLKRGEIG